MDQPTEEHHLQDLGSSAGADPAAGASQNGSGEGSIGPGQPDDDPTGPTIETMAGRLGFEGSADNPTQDDHFTGGSR